MYSGQDHHADDARRVRNHRLASFIDALFAGILFSYVADRFGRRSIFAFALLWYGIASFIMAFQNAAFGLNLWRFIATIGLGVKLVTVDAYLSELIPRLSRGRAFAFLLAVSAFAGPFTYFLASQLVPIAPFRHCRLAMDRRGQLACCDRRLDRAARPPRESALAGPIRGRRWQASLLVAIRDRP